MPNNRTQLHLALARMSSTLTAQRGRMGLLQRQLDASDRDLERLTARVDAQLQRIDAVVKE